MHETKLQKNPRSLLCMYTPVQQEIQTRTRHLQMMISGFVTRIITIIVQDTKDEQIYNNVLMSDGLCLKAALDLIIVHSIILTLP